jgi:hypothetical protein
MSHFRRKKPRLIWDKSILVRPGVRKVYHDVRKVHHVVRKVYHRARKVYHGSRKVYHGSGIS